MSTKKRKEENYPCAIVHTQYDKLLSNDNDNKIGNYNSFTDIDLINWANDFWLWIYVVFYLKDYPRTQHSKDITNE